MQYFPISSFFIAIVSLIAGRFEKTSRPMVVTWLIDGSNLQCCTGSKGGKKEREEVIQELKQIASPENTKLILPNDVVGDPKTITNVVLVFDGNLDEAFDTVKLGDWFRIVTTDGEGKKKDRADDYIVNYALPELQNRFSFPKERGGGQHHHVIHLVSADKELKKRAVATRTMNGGSVVHPPKFWKQYLPNLQKRQQGISSSLT